MKKIVILLTLIMSFSAFSNDKKSKSEINEFIVYGVNLQKNILERKEKLHNDMVITTKEMKILFAKDYKIEIKNINQYNFIIKS